MFGLLKLFKRDRQDSAGDLSEPIESPAQLFDKSVAHACAGDFAASLQCASQAVRLAPGNVDYRLQMAQALLGLEAPEDAIRVLRDALPLSHAPDRLLSKIGDLQLELGDFTAANAVADELANLGNALEAQVLLARTAFRQQQWDKATKHYRAVQSIDPGDYRGANGLGSVLLSTGEFDAAALCFEEALRLNPSADEPYNNLGVMLENKGELARAAEYYQTAYQKNPMAVQARFNAALAWLKQGDYRRGWEAYEIRFRVPEHKSVLPVRDTSRLWNGGDPAGLDLLVLGEQGFGDQIQFSRYLPLLAGKGARIHFVCSPELLQLFATLAGQINLYPEGAVVPAHDCQCALMSLPHLLGTTIESIPATIPYLRAETGKLAAWQKRIVAPGKVKIGLVWSSSHRYVAFRFSHVPLQAFASLWQQPAAQCFSLQMERSMDEALPQEVIDLAVDIVDFSDTAAALTALDLVVTIDTAVAHLAGALGRPVWLIVRHDAEWRWLTGREDSPWYPSMRIFRQGRAECWPDVLERVSRSITESKGFLPGSPKSDTVCTEGYTNNR